jgi:hypothetical protein
MKKIFFKTEPYQISSDNELQSQIITKIFIFDLLSEKVYFSFKVKTSRNSDESLIMKKNFLDLISMIYTPEFHNSYNIENEKAEKILRKKIKDLNGYFFKDFCENYGLHELML